MGVGSVQRHYLFVALYAVKLPLDALSSKLLDSFELLPEFDCGQFRQNAKHCQREIGRGISLLPIGGRTGSLFHGSSLINCR